jgi:hypothetical protein
MHEEDLVAEQAGAALLAQLHELTEGPAVVAAGAA